MRDDETTVYEHHRRMSRTHDSTQRNFSPAMPQVFGLEEVGHVLGPGVLVQVVVVIVVAVSVVCRTNVLHLVDGSTLHAARLGLLAGKSDPEHVVRVGGKTSATNVLLVTSGVDGDGVLHRACGLSTSHHTTGSLKPRNTHVPSSSGG